MKVGDLMPLISAFTFNISSILNVGRTIIDLILVWYVIYLLISMMKQNMRTMQLFKGVLLILILKMFTSLLRLSAMDYLVDTILTWGVVAIIIVFQPEIRGLLEKIGRTKLVLKQSYLRRFFGKELLFMMEQRSLKGIGLSVRPPFIHPPIRN